MERIHRASLEILETIGVVIPHPEVLRRLADCGAVVDFPGSRALHPPDGV